MELSMMRTPARGGDGAGGDAGTVRESRGRAATMRNTVCPVSVATGGRVVVTAPLEGYPVSLTLDAPERVANWRPLVAWLLVIPHFIVAYFLRLVGTALTAVAFFTVLFTKQIPENLFSIIVMTYRYQWRITSYALFLREEYPPFDFDTSGPDNGLDRARLEIPYPGEMQRWAPLYKWFLAIPHYILLAFLWIGAVVVILISFFVVLFTGRWNDGMREYVVNVYAWSIRVQAYVGLLTDSYPPFALG
jgi:hypothetical protein